MAFPKYLDNNAYNAIKDLFKGKTYNLASPNVKEIKIWPFVVVVQVDAHNVLMVII